VTSFARTQSSRDPYFLLRHPRHNTYRFYSKHFSLLFSEIEVKITNMKNSTCIVISSATVSTFAINILKTSERMQKLCALHSGSDFLCL
jgi:hypothetical protein